MNKRKGSYTNNYNNYVDHYNLYLQHYYNYYTNDDENISIPSDFNAESYIILNNLIGYNKSQAESHYLSIGWRSKLPYKYSLPKDFDWKEYCSINNLPYTDINNASIHYINYGKRHNLKYKKQIIETNSLNFKINNSYKKKKNDPYAFLKECPYLFHKYLLNIVKIDDNINYNIVKNPKNSNIYWAHLHCYNIDDFDNIFGEYIYNISRYFSIIVTYSIGICRLKNDFVIIQIPNKGMDIGAKIIAINYLRDKNIPYTHLLMLHSKKNLYKRYTYFKYLVGTKTQLDKIVSLMPDNELIMPDLIHRGEYGNEYYTINSLYYNQYNKLTKMSHQTNNFVEGNCLIASKKIIDKIFVPKFTKFFYVILNNEASFDYNYVRSCYKLPVKKINSVYNYQKLYDLSPNHLNSETFRDGSIEHLWERLWINTLLNIKGKYTIIERNSVEHKYSNFNWKSYVDNHDDLKHMNEPQALRHYIEYGEKEGRIIENYSVTNFNNHICIFHCGDFEIFEYLLKKFPNILKMKLIITYYKDSYYEKLVNVPNINIVYLLKVANKGTDIGPFLLIMKFLFENSHLYDDDTTFIKIHTKSITKNQYWTETLIKDILCVNISNTDIPIMIGSDEFIYNQNKSINYNTMKNIHNRYFKDNNFDLYFNIYNTDKLNDKNKINNFTDLNVNNFFYKEYEKLPLEHWYKHGINEFHRKSNVNYVKKWALKNNYFVAGTIFGFNIKFLQLFKIFDLDYEYSILEEGYVNNHNETNLHAWEYFFGFYTIISNGKILGFKDNVVQKTYLDKNKDNVPPIYSVINQPFSKSKIAFFLIVPGKIPNSGGFRTLLNYIKLLNEHNFSVDLYFGICVNDYDVKLNVSILDKYGVPACSNWFNPKIDHIDLIIQNIKNYNVIDIDKNNYYIGFNCQRNYEIIVANAWQTAEAVYQNKNSAKKLYYIIQDREELFYPNDIERQNNVIKTYKNEFYYYCITQYLFNYFKDTYKFKNITGSCMGVNLDIYKNYNQDRENSIIIPYYKDVKSGRKPDLVEKIINVLSSYNIKCYVYPYNYDKNTNKNIINLGTMTEYNLNQLYNKYKVGIIFSNTNPSRLGFEMYASGLQVIEYDTEFTTYDMPNEYFTKIKNEENIVSIVKSLFNKKYNNEFLKNIDIKTDYNNFLTFLNI